MPWPVVTLSRAVHDRSSDLAGTSGEVWIGIVSFVFLALLAILYVLVWERWPSGPGTDLEPPTTPESTLSATTMQGKRVLIVGGTSGIGLAIAADLAADGARVTVASRTASRVEEAIASTPTLAGHVVDTTDPESLRWLADVVGELDHVVSCAGQGAAGRLLDVELDAVRFAFESKVVGQLDLARAITPNLQPGGSLTLFSGLYGIRPDVGVGAISMANAAVEVLGRTLALELAPIRVNVIAPGLVDTPAYAAMPTEQRKGMFASVAAATPVGRVGTAEDFIPVTRACLMSGFLSGAVLHVDGGGSAR